ncbi:MAG: calcineurin-like phosphoesterase family protein [Dysgonamonadaceae bacterium]|jgi:hypothetical protein|nr:calcineurin-like phosphoesterase family protein [Dysgonamonadaceae bacterium]
MKKKCISQLAKQASLFAQRISQITVCALFFVACGGGDITDIPGEEPGTGTTEPSASEYTLYGKIYCNGTGVSNVVVTDGYLFSVTDFDGYYHLKSLKEHGYVYITIPSGYEPAGRNGIVMPFFKYTQKDAFTEERIDFELKQVNNTNHTLLVMTDAHFINNGDGSGKNDISQVNSLLMPELRSAVSQHKALEKPLYCLCLGDMVEDIYWTSFSYSNYLSLMREVNMPFFHTMGNHEYSVAYSGDWNTAKDYKHYLGPPYYSFNLGSIHYVVIDDMICTNPGNGLTRSVTGQIDDAQLAWLQKDLSFVDKNTPVVLATHIPVFNETVSGSGAVSHPVSLSNGKALNDLLANYKEVYYLTGHTHINKSAQAGNILERNIAAVSGSWWFTLREGYSARHICCDGSPGGYQLYNMQGAKVSWQYKGLGQSVNKQFRTYDRNQIHITAAKYCPNGTSSGKTNFNSTFSREYGTANTENYVYINIWGWDPAWKLEVKENGASLTPTRMAAYDPLKIIAYEAMYTDKQKTVYDYAMANQSTHFFRVKASSAASTLEIKVTDRFGNVYTETMTRPKVFDINAD